MAAESGERGSHRLLGSGLLLSIVSFAIVLYTGSAEPFIVFSWPDLVLLGAVGLVGVTLCVGFTIWAVACVRHARRVPRARSSRRLLSMACVLWTAINLFYLGTMVYGCAQDLSNPYLARARWR
jgi:uncharacterized membrane protein YbhN (UPF0104 family)